MSILMNEMAFLILQAFKAQERRAKSETRLWTVTLRAS